MVFIIEQPRHTPVIDDVDLCILGGSCTGVFAAVRAARLGAKVALVEQQNCFGGVATSGMVNIWHTLRNTEFTQQIIAGLTLETVERLEKRHAATRVDNSPSQGFYLNTEELKIELDELVLESGITPYLHTTYVAPYVENGILSAILVENKSGRGAIKAKMFIDATGDGDLCAHLGIPFRSPVQKQPPTTCAHIYGLDSLQNFNIYQDTWRYKDAYHLPDGFMWSAPIPGLPNMTLLAGTRVYDVDCANGNDLTHAEIEGRRQLRAIMDIARTHGGDSQLALAKLPSYIGIRETRHIDCQYRLTEHDVLTGRRFDDAIANGSYRVDVHHEDKPGVTFRYLDGTEVYHRTGMAPEAGRWRPETAENPTFYQIPYRSLVPQGSFANLLVCGRAVDADTGAYGAIRVMVNMNQTGEAAGVAAYLALNGNMSVSDVHPARLRAELTNGGSIIM